MEKSTKIHILSQSAIITIFTFMLISFVIPSINSNSDDIKENSNDINEIKIVMADLDIDEIDGQLEKINSKLDKIVLGMCGEFGGKYCE